MKCVSRDEVSPSWRAARDAFVRRLKAANVADIELTRRNLRGADLQGICFANKDMSFTHLQGAILQGSDFCGANLASVQVDEDTDWKGALFNKHTQLPFSEEIAFQKGMLKKGDSYTSIYISMDAATKIQAILGILGVVVIIEHDDIFRPRESRERGTKLSYPNFLPNDETDAFIRLCLKKLSHNEGS